MLFFPSFAAAAVQIQVSHSLWLGLHFSLLVLWQRGNNYAFSEYYKTMSFSQSHLAQLQNIINDTGPMAILENKLNDTWFCLKMIHSPGEADAESYPF